MASKTTSVKLCVCYGKYWTSWYALVCIVVCILECIGMYRHGMYCGMYWYVLFLVCIASIGMYWFVLTFHIGMH